MVSNMKVTIREPENNAAKWECLIESASDKLAAALDDLYVEERNLADQLQVVQAHIRTIRESSGERASRAPLAPWLTADELNACADLADDMDVISVSHPRLTGWVQS